MGNDNNDTNENFLYKYFEAPISERAYHTTTIRIQNPHKTPLIYHDTSEIDKLKRQIERMSTYILEHDINEDICLNVPMKICNKYCDGECDKCIIKYFEEV